MGEGIFRRYSPSEANNRANNVTLGGTIPVHLRPLPYDITSLLPDAMAVGYISLILGILVWDLKERLHPSSYVFPAPPTPVVLV